MNPNITPEIGEAAARLLMSDSRLIEIIDGYPNGRSIISGLYNLMGCKYENSESARRDLLVALGCSLTPRPPLEPAPKRRLIAAATHQDFVEYCTAEGINPRDQRRVVFIHDLSQVRGCERGTNLYLLPGSINKKGLHSVIREIRNRDGQTIRISFTFQRNRTGRPYPGTWLPIGPSEALKMVSESPEGGSFHGTPIKELGSNRPPVGFSGIIFPADGEAYWIPEPDHPEEIEHSLLSAIDYLATHSRLIEWIALPTKRWQEIIDRISI